MPSHVEQRVSLRQGPATGDSSIDVQCPINTICYVFRSWLSRMSRNAYVDIGTCASIPSAEIVLAGASLDALYPSHQLPRLPSHLECQRWQFLCKFF